MAKPRSHSRTSTRSTDGAFTDAELESFLAGDWVTCRSSCVREARWLADGEALEALYDGGVVYRYAGVGESVAREFAAAASKRGFIHDRLDPIGNYVRVS